MRWLNRLVAALPAMAVICVGQDAIAYLDEPVVSWSSDFPAMGIGNGVFVSPNGEMVVAVGRNGLVRAFQPTTGEVLWTYSPELRNGGAISCTSGITFADDVDTPFLTYIVNDNVGGTLSSRVIVLSADGVKIVESTSLPGEGAGTPKVTRDGTHVVVTSNLNETGYFSVLYLDAAEVDPADPNQLLPVAPMFRYRSSHMQFDAPTPFSDVGFFHSPSEGWYESSNNVGLGNTNDIFVWMTDTNKKIVGTTGDPVAGEAVLYFFQLPIDYQPGSNASSPIDVAISGGNTSRPYQSNTRPILTNSGRSMYWAMSRGEVRSWLDREFTRGHSNMTSLGRGDPAYIGPRASPTLSSNPVQPMVFGVGSANLVWKTDFDLGSLITVATDTTVSSRIAITADDLFVFYGTDSGELYMASTSNLAARWGVGGIGSNITFTSIKADIAVHPSGSMLYVPDTASTSTGSIVGLWIAPPPPSVAPTASPTLLPTVLASSAPTVKTSSQPTFSEDLDDKPTASTPSKSPALTPTAKASPKPTSSSPSNSSQVPQTSGAAGLMRTSWFNGRAMLACIVPLLMTLVVAM